MAYLITSGRFAAPAGGTIETYRAGTLIPQVTYTTQGGTIPNPTTIQVPASGYVPVWGGEGLSYRMIVRDSDGVVVYDTDGITYPSAGTTGTSSGGADALVTDAPWNADKTGATNAQPAIQACLDHWIAKGLADGCIYTVRLPAGKYKLGSGLRTGNNLGTGQVALVGDGMLSTRLQPDGDFTAVSLVTSYVHSGGFSIEWPLTARASIPPSRIGVDFADAQFQVAQCRVADILVMYAHNSFANRNWGTAPGTLGTMYVVDFERLISFRAAGDGFFFAPSGSGSTTHRFSTCWANCSDSTGAPGGTGFSFDGINDVNLINCAVDLAKDKAVTVLSGFQFNALGLALESCSSVTDGAALVSLSGLLSANIVGLKEIAGTVNIPSGRAYGVFAGPGVACNLSGYASTARTMTAGSFYKASLNSADTAFDVDRSVSRAEVDPQGWLTAFSFGGERVSMTNAAPTQGAWAVGDYVRNGAPAVGQPKGWVCTVAGSPGTWVSVGNL